MSKTDKIILAMTLICALEGLVVAGLGMLG